jgi:hypothetical protein
MKAFSLFSIRSAQWRSGRSLTPAFGSLGGRRLPTRHPPLQGFAVLYGSGALRGIRTPDPQIRSLVLYPAELAARPQFRVLELTPEGIHQYGGGYTENVARTGHEAPGLHPG